MVQWVWNIFLDHWKGAVEQCLKTLQDRICTGVIKRDEIQHSYLLHAPAHAMWHFLKISCLTNLEPSISTTTFKMRLRKESFRQEFLSEEITYRQISTISVFCRLVVGDFESGPLALSPIKINEDKKTINALEVFGSSAATFSACVVLYLEL